MKHFLIIYSLFFLLSSLGNRKEESRYKNISNSIKYALEKGVTYFHSISTQGGYVYFYTLDLEKRWSDDGICDEFTIEIQPPGTPTLGNSFIRAYKITKNIIHLEAAKDAARALIIGQNEIGGWNHQIHLNRPKENIVSFDDDQTQSALRFLMALDQEIVFDSLKITVKRGLQMMLDAQFENGGWPHRYPKEGNTNDFATFNDSGINDCIKVMMDANRFFDRDVYKKSIEKAGWFLFISQQPPPQTGWAQQYNDFLQPAWARDFEPASLSPLVTINNVNTLIDLYLHTKKPKHLKLIPDALKWMDDVQLQNGNWPRFVELGTNKPLYYDNGRIRVDTFEELSLDRRTGYKYELDLKRRLKEVTSKFEKVNKLGWKIYLEEINRPLTKEEIHSKLNQMEPEIMKILKDQDSNGRWVTKNDRYRKAIPRTKWNGEYIVNDRVSSLVFSKNINLLCEYLELIEKSQN